MLSRVAENIYWMARYIERVENTARLISVNTLMLLDLPRQMTPGWGHLLVITGTEERFQHAHREASERQVISFLLAGKGNPGSVLISVRAARENCRTIRDFVPREAWERLNSLFYYCQDNVQMGRSKRGRHAYLTHIVSACQTLTGLLAGTMNHDEGYQFLRIGRNLERADMTSRIIDVRTYGRLAGPTWGERPEDNIQWLGVLRSLSADHMYRRGVQASIRRGTVLRFLIRSSDFPRAINHCLLEIARSLDNLQGAPATVRIVRDLRARLEESPLDKLSPTDLHHFLDRIQFELGRAHDQMAARFFLPAPRPDSTDNASPEPTP